MSIKTRDAHTIQLGAATLDLSAVEQVIHRAQTRAIGAALDYARRKYIDGQRHLAEILDLVLSDIERDGLDVLDSRRIASSPASVAMSWPLRSTVCAHWRHKDSQL